MNFFWLVWLELLLLVKGLKWYWWAGMIFIWVGSIFAENETMRQIWFSLSSIWPVLVWSKMGEREPRYHTEQLIYQSAYSLARVLTASWLAGVMVTALSISGVLVGRWVERGAGGSAALGSIGVVHPRLWRLHWEPGARAASCSRSFIRLCGTLGPSTTKTG